jgi:hypothetical protein
VSYASEVTADTPVGYWRLNETSGTVAADSVSTNTGTYTGSPTLGVTGLITGESSTGVRFAGGTSVQYVSVANHASLNPASVSVEALFQALSWPGNSRILQKGTTDQQYLLTRSGSNLVFMISGGPTASVALSDTARHHVVGTYDQATGVAKLYIDGSLVSTATGTAGYAAPSSTDILAIGQKPGSADVTDGFNGTLDEAALYNYALSSTRVAAHWSAASAAAAVTAPSYAVLRRGVPLHVELRTSRNRRRVTREVRDLVFRSVAPGGFASAAISLDRPLEFEPDEIAQFGSLVIYDGRNANTVWEGRVEDPGRSASGDGELYEVTALGGRAHAQDITAPYVAVDQRLEPWERGGGSRSYVDTRQEDNSVNIPSLTQSINEGQTVATGILSRFIYPLLYEAGQKLARVTVRHDMGVTDANNLFLIVAQGDTNLSGGDIAYSASWSTSSSLQSKVVVTDWANGRTVPELRIHRNTSAAVAGVEVWCEAQEPTVRSMLVTAAGTEITTGYTTDTVLASQIVADLVGRRLPRFDGANARIDATARTIDQFAYPDPVTAEQILADLIEIESAYYWAAWETNASTGKYRFEWRPWPTAVRYEATTVDGFTSPQSSAELYNAVTVRWRNRRSRVGRSRYTQSVPALTAAGLTREGNIDLSDERGSVYNAGEVGANFLADHASTGNAGTLTIARPVLDRDTGRMAQPWEIRPGHLVRVRGVMPRVDSLNTNTRDGVTIFRVVSTEYRQSDNAVQLELDSYSRTQAQALAELARRPLRRR